MAAILTKTLTYFLGERQKAFRPTVWRNLLPVRGGIPGWAESVEIVKLSPMGTEEPVPGQTGNQKAPSPSFDRSGGTLPMRRYDLSYQIFQADLDKAAAIGINVSALAPVTNQRVAEEFLDKIAAGVGGPTNGLPGLSSSPDVPVGTLLSGGDWANCDEEEILIDIGDMLYSVRENTKQTHNANRIILPDNKYKILAQRIMGNGASLLSAIRESYPGVEIRDWFKLRNAGAGSTTRAIVMEASADVASMLMAYELTDGEPLKIHGGYEVLQSMKTGGVLIEQPLAISYFDGI